MQSISNNPLQLDIFIVVAPIDVSNPEVIACVAELLLSALQCRQQQLLAQEEAVYVESN